MINPTEYIPYSFNVGTTEDSAFSEKFMFLINFFPWE